MKDGNKSVRDKKLYSSRCANPCVVGSPFRVQNSLKVAC